MEENLQNILQNNLKIYQSINMASTMPTNFQNTASRILQTCAENLSINNNALVFNPLMCENVGSPLRQTKKTIKNNTYFSSTAKNIFFQQISPQEEEENNKIIERLRQKQQGKNKNSKQNIIRKTELGQNELIFTEQQLQRLKEIDDYEMLGISYKPTDCNPLSNIEQELGSDEQKQNQKGKYFNFNLSGGQNVTDEIKNYLSWVDLKSVKQTHNKKKSKILNFQKRDVNTGVLNLLRLPHAVKKTKSSKKMANGRGKSGFNTSLMKKNSVDKVFLNSVNPDEGFARPLSNAQLLHKLIQESNIKIDNEYSKQAVNGQRKYVYMTEQRKQALYECQVLRRVKSELGLKVYSKLMLTVGDGHLPLPVDKQQDGKENVSQNESWGKAGQFGNNGQNNFSNSAGQSKNEVEMTEAGKILDKNNNRIKQQRKRIIEKLIC